MAGGVLIDWTAVLESQEGETDVVLKLASLYVDRSAAMIKMMEDAVAKHDAQALGFAAHSLKTAMNIMLLTVGGKVAEALEKQGFTGEFPADAGMRVADLSAIVTVSTAEIRAWIAAVQGDHR